MEDVTAWITGAVGAGAATVLSWAKGWRGRRAIGRLISGAVDLDEQTSKAVSVSIAALQSALDNALKEHNELGKQVSELRDELVDLRSQNMEYVIEIQAMRVEVNMLKAENTRLKERLRSMGS